MDLQEVDESICPRCNHSTEGATINCDSCRYWFHLECVDVTENDDCVINEDLPYYCPTCVLMKGGSDLKYKYTCPKCPMVSALKEMQQHCKVVHSSKSNMKCYDCRKNFMLSCPVVLSKPGDRFTVENVYTKLSNLDISKSLYYFCTYCEPVSNEEQLIFPKLESLNVKDQNISRTSHEPILNLKRGRNKLVQQQIPIAEIIKVEGSNEVYSYETEQLGFESEKIGQKISIGMAPPDNNKKIRDKWKGYKCPITECKYTQFQTLTLLKSHIDLFHKGWGSKLSNSSKLAT